MITDENKLVSEPYRTQTCGKGDLRRLIDNTVVKFASGEQGTTFSRLMTEAKKKERKINALVNTQTRSGDDRW